MLASFNAIAVAVQPARRSNSTIETAMHANSPEACVDVSPSEACSRSVTFSVDVIKMPTKTVVKAAVRMPSAIVLSCESMVS